MDVFAAAAQYPHYLAGAGPHDLQAAAAATAYGSLHNNLPPGLNAYPRTPLVSMRGASSRKNVGSTKDSNFACFSSFPTVK